MDKLLTVKEVAELLNCSPSTIYSWAETKKISSHKINGLLRFRLKDIEALTENMDIRDVKPSSLKNVTPPLSGRNISKIINESIASVKNTQYNTHNIGETRQNQARKGE